MRHSRHGARPAVSGFLLDATPLEWDESLEVIRYVREHGIAQFIHLYNRIKDIEGDRLLWGDEVEYAIFKLDAERGTVKLSLRGAEILAGLQEGERSVPVGQQCNWVPEWGSWMVEGTPGMPYSGYATDLLLVEKNMRTRRARLLAALAEDEICPTLPCFPLMGVGTFTDPPARPTPGLSDSLFVPDEIINPAPRFAALVKNIKRRRGSKVDIRVPRYRDEKTPDAARSAPPPRDAAVAETLHASRCEQACGLPSARDAGGGAARGRGAHAASHGTSLTRRGRPAPRRWRWTRCTWTRWPLGWAAAACKSPSRPRPVPARRAVTAARRL